MRAIAAMAAIGQPLRRQDASRLRVLADRGDAGAAKEADEILGGYVLADVVIGPKGLGRTRAGAAPRRLAEQGWAAFLVRVENPSSVTAPLRVTSSNSSVLAPAATLARAPRVLPEPRFDSPEAIRQIWFRNELYEQPPMTAALSGAPVEFQILQIFSRDRGAREMDVGFHASADPWAEYMLQQLGLNEPLTFDCEPSQDVLVRVHDSDGRPCMASLVIKDGRDRLYPYQPMRLAPDMWFQPQVYRADGETIRLPRGTYTVEGRRGPEYLTVSESIVLAAEGGQIDIRLERWIDPAKWGWYSGDTHIHASGCSHYVHPTEGVSPETMIRHVRGEGLSIGEVLTWGPGWERQKPFFSGKAISPPADVEHPELQVANGASLVPRPTPEDAESSLRYDVEVSGFPSSQNGHLVLLRLKQQDYPGTTRVDDWPSWNLPILKWAKAQGALVGYAHCGDGMEVRTNALPNYEIPPMDGQGTQEAIVDLTHGLTDFLSGGDTLPLAELNGWYHLLNCGFRLAMVGETDFPCYSGERPGVGRSYVRLDQRPVGDQGYEAWIRNLALGRLYYGDGRSHFLQWTVAGRASGEGDVALPRAGAVSVQALVAARLAEKIDGEAISPRSTPSEPRELRWDIENARIGQSRNVAVELVVNGQAVAQKILLADGLPRKLSFSTQVDRSSWIALRILPSAHTHPIYVTVGGRAVRASKRSAQWCRECVDKLWAVKSPMIRESERSEAAEAYDHARRVYDKIIAECDRP